MKIVESYLTHWGWVMHILISKLTIISLDNGLSPGRRQAIIWTNVGILLIGPFQWNLNQNLYIFIQENAFENVIRKLRAILYQLQCVNKSIQLLHIDVPPLKWIDKLHMGTHWHISQTSIDLAININQTTKLVSGIRFHGTGSVHRFLYC